MAMVLIPPHLTFPGDPNPVQHWVWVGHQQAELSNPAQWEPILHMGEEQHKLSAEGQLP